MTDRKSMSEEELIYGFINDACDRALGQPHPVQYLRNRMQELFTGMKLVPAESAVPVAWRVRWANGEVELTEDAERVEEYRIAKEQFAQLTITPLAALTTTETNHD